MNNINYNLSSISSIQFLIIRLNLSIFINKFLMSVQEKLLFIEDETIYKWYFEKKSDIAVPKTKVSAMLKNFKL